MLVLLFLLGFFLFKMDTAASNMNLENSYDPTGKKLYWEQVESETGGRVYRTWLPDGWLISQDAIGLTFYPDPEHEWKPLVKKGSPWAAIYP